MRAWFDPEGEGVELREEILAKAHALQKAHAEGARFVVIPTRDLRESATWIFASFRSPLAAVPLPPYLPGSMAARRLAQLPPGTVVSADSLKPAKIGISQPKPLGAVWAVIFTSGSSGEPKGVALSGAALESSAKAHAEHSRAPNSTWLLDLPLFHVGGFSVLSRSHFLGTNVALSQPKFHAARTAAWLNSGKVQGISLVPTTLFRLLHEPGVNFSGLDLILLGGAASDPILVDEALNRGAPVRLTYGMTEHSSQIATEGKPREGLRALPGVELKIDNKEEILVRSPCLASGFFREGILIPLPLLEDGFFATGDLGECAEGKLTVRGRASELIVSGGKKVFPSPVEGALAKLPGVRDAAVFPEPDPEWGEVVCAAIVEESSGAFCADEAKRALALNLEAHEIPRRWVILNAVPRSEAGKVLRSELRKMARAQTQS